MKDTSEIHLIGVFVVILTFWSVHWRNCSIVLAQKKEFILQHPACLVLFFPPRTWVHAPNATNPRCRHLKSYGQIRLLITFFPWSSWASFEHASSLSYAIFLAAGIQWRQNQIDLWALCATQSRCVHIHQRKGHWYHAQRDWWNPLSNQRPPQAPPVTACATSSAHWCAALNAFVARSHITAFG